MDRGESDLARSLYSESLTVIRRLVYPPIIAKALEGLAAVAVAADSDGERSLQLLGAAAMLRQTAGAKRPPFDQERVSRTEERARARTRSERAEAAWHTGLGLSREQAITLALEW